MTRYIKHKNSTSGFTIRAWNRWMISINEAGYYSTLFVSFAQGEIGVLVFLFGREFKLGKPRVI